MQKEIKGRAKGGHTRAANLSDERKQEIAKKAAVARWGVKAIHKGNFKEDFGIDVECYVINDEHKTAVISQRGMAEAIGLSRRGERLQRFAQGKAISKFIGPELRSKLDNPLIFQISEAAQESGTGKVAHGYDVTILIDLCNAIIKAKSEGVSITENVTRQSQIIVNSSAKLGIRGLVYSLAGYSPTTQEVIEAFKLYIQEEAKKYEQEFPNELYMQWHRLYKIPVPVRGKPWHFKHLTVKHIYFPLAKSNGKILSLLRALKGQDGSRQKKLFQFLNDIGARALRMQLGRILEMAESSNTSEEYEAKIIKRFGDQQELDLIIPSSSNAS